ncbi:type I restriction-modification enzyme R subunit C-terminal domain-containing protein, partial [Sulfurospirillum cavolei]|uniref:type I restriction-modification enzyme R subunit C-terminal domain-containing protein n=1 Tax=Sulfurospirillum cavolei TaxID=366522 RepID=UPI003FA2FED9
IEIKSQKLRVINIETSYVGSDGKPHKTSEYLTLLVGILGEFYDDEEKLRDVWANPKSRRALLERLRAMNIDDEQLEDLKTIFDAPQSDIYDVLAHLSFNLELKTRSERVLSVEHGDFLKRHHSEKAKAFLEFILERYEKEGVKELDEDKLSSLIELSRIDKSELKNAFGGVAHIKEEYLELQREIYK